MIVKKKMIKIINKIKLKRIEMRKNKKMKNQINKIAVKTFKNCINY